MVQVIEKNKKKEPCECEINLSRAHVPCHWVGASFLINNNEPHQLRVCSTYSSHALKPHARQIKPRGHALSDIWNLKTLKRSVLNTRRG